MGCTASIEPAKERQLRVVGVVPGAGAAGSPRGGAGGAGSPRPGIAGSPRVTRRGVGGDDEKKPPVSPFGKILGAGRGASAGPTLLPSCTLTRKGRRPSRRTRCDATRAAAAAAGAGVAAVSHTLLHHAAAPSGKIGWLQRVLGGGKDDAASPAASPSNSPKDKDGKDGGKGQKDKNDGKKPDPKKDKKKDSGEELQSQCLTTVSGGKRSFRRPRPGDSVPEERGDGEEGRGTPRPIGGLRAGSRRRLNFVLEDDKNKGGQNHGTLWRLLRGDTVLTHDPPQRRLGGGRLETLQRVGPPAKRTNMTVRTDYGEVPISLSEVELQQVVDAEKREEEVKKKKEKEDKKKDKKKKKDDKVKEKEEDSETVSGLLRARERKSQVRDMQLRPVGPGHPRPVASITLSGCGRLLLSTDAEGGNEVQERQIDQILRCIDPSNGQEIATLRTAKRDLPMLCYYVMASPSGELVAACDNTERVVLWRTDSWRVKDRPTFSAPPPRWHGDKKMEFFVHCVAFSSDEKALVVGGVTSHPDDRLEDSDEEASPNAYGGGRLNFKRKKGRAVVWDLSAKKQGAAWEEHRGAVSCCAFTHDSQGVCTGAADGGLYVWFASSGLRKNVLGGHPGRISGVSFSTDGTLLVSSCPTFVCVWNAQTGLPIAARSIEPSIVLPYVDYRGFYLQLAPAERDELIRRAGATRGTDDELFIDACLVPGSLVMAATASGMVEFYDASSLANTQYGFELRGPAKCISRGRQNAALGDEYGNTYCVDFILR